MADADSSDTQLAELETFTRSLYDLSCEIDAVAQVASVDDASPIAPLGFLLSRFSERMAMQVAGLQQVLTKGHTS
ncbi:hypothetical protein [Acidovorax sp. BL-A-41-H1]|uniref:hypothetical protein n=1 Tax=Acidovorax sp. BL-A-41-H1 TaxID=3421102 RepID=UPI003F7A3750